MQITKQITQNQTVNSQLVISVKQLAILLTNITRSMTISLTYFVDLSESKTVEGQKQVQKRVKINQAYLNHDYGNKVRNKTGNADFEAYPLNGKERMSSTILSSLSKKNYGKLMIDVKIEDYSKAKLQGYFHNGLPIELNKNNPTFGRTDLVTPSFYNVNSDYTSGRNTVSQDDDFKMITPFLDNIETIKIQGQEYLIKS